MGKYITLQSTLKLDLFVPTVGLCFWGGCSNCSADRKVSDNIPSNFSLALPEAKGQELCISCVALIQCYETLIQHCVAVQFRGNIAK